MSLQGNLREMSLANLIQVNCQEVRSVRLTLTHEGQTVTVFIADGQLVHAENGTTQGESVVYQALLWDHGTFSLDADIPAPAQTIRIPWSAILLEGMKRASENITAAKRAQLTPASDTRPSSDLRARLKALEGVESVVIASSDGVVLDSDISADAEEREAAVAVFIGGAARQFSEFLQLGQFHHGIVLWKNRRVLVLETPDRYFGLVLGERGSPAIVAAAALKVIG